MELIDFKKKGNVVRLYLGKNGEQWGDNWDDAPYEYNAEKVEDKYVEKIVDVFFPFPLEVMEPADKYPNPPYSKQDFINRKSWVIWIYDDSDNSNELSDIGIFFGDTLAYIRKRLKPYGVIFKEVKNV